jgi:hypothetical protein
MRSSHRQGLGTDFPFAPSASVFGEFLNGGKSVQHHNIIMAMGHGHAVGYLCDTCCMLDLAFCSDADFIRSLSVSRNAGLSVSKGRRALDRCKF